MTTRKNFPDRQRERREKALDSTNKSIRDELSKTPSDANRLDRLRSTAKNLKNKLK